MNTGDPSAAPKRPTRRRRGRTGLVIVNTGNGKGKTTAALGVLFRAWGRDFKVRMFQFIKHTGARFGENRAAAKLGIPMESLRRWLHMAFERYRPDCGDGRGPVGPL